MPADQRGIGEHLPHGLLLQLRGDRGHHPVLGQERAHRRDVHAALAERPQLLHRVVAVGEVHRLAVEEDLVPVQHQLARVGVADLHPQPAMEVLGEQRLLLRAILGPARLDEAEAPSGPAERLEVLEHLSGEQLPDVLPERQPQRRVLLPEQRSETLLEDPLRRRQHVQPADAGQVGLEELEGALPLRALEENHRVEPSEDRVRARVERGPAVADPLLVTVGNRERRPDVRVHQPQLEQAAGRIVQRQRRRVEVCLLLRQDGERRREDGHRLRAALVQVEETRGVGVLVDPVEHVSHPLRGDAEQRRLDPAAHLPAQQSELLCRGLHAGAIWTQDRCPPGTPRGCATGGPQALRPGPPGPVACGGLPLRVSAGPSCPALDHAPRLRLCSPAVRSASRPAR